MKKLVVTVLALIVILGVVVLVGPSFVDWNSYKTEIARTVEEQTGRRLDIDGDISFQVLPAPRLSAERLKLANIAGGRADTFISADALQIHVALAPLLSGKIKVASITLQNPVVALEQFPDGRNNWTFGDPAGAMSETASAGSEADAADGGNIDLTLDGATIANGRVSFFDHGTGTSHSISGLNVALSASSLNGPFKLTGDFSYKEVPVILSAATGKMDAGRATPLEAIATLGNRSLELSYSGTLVLGDRPRLMGTIGAVGEDLVTASATLAPLDVATGTLPPLLAGPFKLSAKLDGSADKAALNDLTATAGGLTAKGAITATLAGRPTIDATLALDRFALDDALTVPNGSNSSGTGTSSVTPEPVGSAETKFALPSEFDANLVLTADAVDYRGGVIRHPRLEASIADGVALLKTFSAQMPGGADVSLSGTVENANGSPQFSGRADFVSDNLRGTLDWLGVETGSIAAERLRKGSFGADIAANPEQIQLTNWTMDLDTTRIRGGLTLLLRERPAFGLALDLGKINLDAYLPPEGETVEPRPAAASDAAENVATSRSPMEQVAVALNSFDANVRIGFEEITVRKTPIIGGLVEARIQNGALSVSELTIADFAGARVALSGSLAGAVSDPNTKLQFEIEATSLARLARLAGLEPDETLQRIGGATLNGSILGDLSALTIDATAKAAGASASVKGIVDPLAQPLDVDLAIKLQHPSADKLAATLSPGTLPKNVTLGSLALAATVTSAADTAYSLDATMDLGGGRLGLKGSVAPGADVTSVSLDTRYAHPDIVALIRGLSPDYTPSKRDLGPVTLETRLEGTTETLKINSLRLGIGPVSLNGTATLALTGARPKLTLSAEAGTIAIDPWLPRGSPTPAGGISPVVPVKSSARTWSRETIDTSALVAADATITLQAEQVLHGAYTLDALDLRATLENGTLTISQLSAKLFEGTLNGTAFLKHDITPEGGLTLSIKNADVRQAAMSASGAAQVTGTLNYETSLNTAGRSEFSLVSGLQGNGSITVNDGSIEGFDLPAVSEQLKQLDRSVDFLMLAQKAMRGGTTPFDSLTGTYRITNGVLQSEDISLKSKTAEGRGTAVVNLPPQEMDVRSQFWLSEHPNSPPIGLRLTGPLDNPRQILDANKLQAFVLQRVIERGILRQFNRNTNSESGTENATTPDAAPTQPVEQVDPRKALRGVLKGLLGN